MRKYILCEILLPFSVAMVFLSCSDDAYLTIAPPPADASFVQEFDSVSAAYHIRYGMPPITASAL
jgi:hypothetical protein